MGRVIDAQTALAMSAGARAIEANKRLQGATYMYDVFGENGEPKEINYGAAAKLLRAISEEVLLGGDTEAGYCCGERKS